MLLNNIRLALRILRREKLFSFIKIVGFAVGIAASILISLFIFDELSYDKQYPDRESIYRLVSRANVNGEMVEYTFFPPPMAKAVEADYEDIEMAGRVLYGRPFAGGMEFKEQSAVESVYEEGFIYADQRTLSILLPTLESGDVHTALSDPESVIISRSKADLYFPEGNALGQTVIIDNEEEDPHTITGIFSDIPHNVHLRYDFMITLTGIELWEGEQEAWSSSNYPIYLKLSEGVDPRVLEEKLLGVNEKYLLPMLMEQLTEVDARATMEETSLLLQPISDIHLRSDGINDNLHHGDLRFVWLFGAIAFFILLLAIINFVNLSTAKSANRAKEVGLRKTVGAFRSELMTQFLSESVIYSILAFIIGVLLAQFLLPRFNSIADKGLEMPWTEAWFIPLLIASAVVTGLIAGLYPAAYLSSYRPVDVLKGERSTGAKSGRLRSALVVFQFTTSIVLIISTLVVYQQMDYILNKDIGYDKDELMLIKGTFAMGDAVHSFKDELLRTPEISQVTMSSYLPVSGANRNGNSFWKTGREQEDKSVSGQIWRVDHDYIETFDMTIVEGRDFSTDFASDTTAIIINEKMAEQMGLDPAIGAEITNNFMNYHVIGVVKDFHFRTVKDAHSPLSLTLGESRSTFAVRFDEGSTAAVRSKVSAIWQKFLPEQAIRLSYLDQDFTEMHEDVRRMSTIFNSFTLFALIIACLGLFALSAFMVEQRRKEISIRLVLGASFRSIYQLLSLDFLKLVLVSFLLAIPIAWYAMSRWLEDYAYRIDIGWEVFALSGVLAFAIAIVTISYQSIGAALIDPMDGLGAE